VKRFALCYRTVVCPVCLSVLSVTLVYCGHTVGCIKMKLVMEGGLGPGHIVLDGDPAPLPQREYPRPIFGPCLLWHFIECGLQCWTTDDTRKRTRPRNPFIN